MSSITEQFSAATKSQLEAQFQIFSTLASTAVASAEKVIALNLNTTRASVEKSSAAAKKLLTVSDPKELFNFSTAEPVTLDSLLAYSRALYGIASAAQTELIHSAQSSLQKVGNVAATAKPAAALPKTPPALAAAVSAAVIAANEPLATIPTPNVSKPKPVAAPIEPEPEQPVEIKTEVRPPFPEPPTKPIALSAEGKSPKPRKK